MKIREIDLYIGPFDILTQKTSTLDSNGIFLDCKAKQKNNFGGVVSILGLFRPFKVSNLKTPFFLFPYDI